MVTMTIQPAVQLLLLGFALSATVTNLKLGVVDDDQSIESRALVNALGESKSFRLTATYSSVNELEKALSRGDLSAGMVVPNDYSRNLRRGEHGGDRDRQDRAALRDVVGHGRDMYASHQVRLRSAISWQLCAVHLRYRALSLVRHRGRHDDRVLQQIGKAVDATRIFRKSAPVLIVRIIESYRGHAEMDAALDRPEPDPSPCDHYARVPD